MGDLARVNTNVAALRSYLTLTKINNQILKTSEKISTGKWINRASDSPSGYYISKVFQRKINALHRFQQNVERGINWLQTNDSKLAQVVDILMEMNDLASQARAGGVTSAERVALQIQLTDLRTEVQDILQSGVSSTIYSGFTLGSLGTVSLTGAATPTLSALTLNGTNVNVTGASTAAQTTTNINNTITNINAAMDRILQDEELIGSWVHRLEFEVADQALEEVNARASLSSIQDADLAREQVELTKYQLLQQTSLAMLVQFNSAPSAILRLFM